MKRIILFVVLIFTTSFINSFAQLNYRVIKVKGSIVILESGESLLLGTVFSDNDKLHFKTANSLAAVINPQKGRFLITPENKDDFANSKTNFLPAMSNISSRGGSIINMNDMQNHFKGNYVVLYKSALQINSEKYPMNEKQFFFLRYKYLDEEINKKLGFSNDTLIIDRETLYTVDGKPIPNPDDTGIKLFYRKGNESVLISEFNLIFPDNDELKREVSIILDEFINKSSEKKVNEVTSYINEYYGKPNQDNLKVWLKENFDLSE